MRSPGWFSGAMRLLAARVGTAQLLAISISPTEADFLRLVAFSADADGGNLQLTCSRPLPPAPSFDIGC